MTDTVTLDWWDVHRCTDQLHDHPPEPYRFRVCGRCGGPFAPKNAGDGICQKCWYG